MLSRRDFLRLAATALAVPALHRTGSAQTYPARPVRLIVPFAAGGPNDTIARIVAAEAFKESGASFVIENIPGGAGNIGTAAAARAPADGHTLVVVTSSFIINPSLNPKIQYDPIASFAPVTMVAAAPHVLVVHPSFPAKDVKEFVAVVRANPGKYGYASAGTGQSSHMAGELFRQSAALDLAHVPFNGAAPAMTSTVGGHTPIAFISLPGAAPFIADGRLRALATTGTARSAICLDVPTMAEAGFEDQASVFMQGMLAPAGTSREIVDQWHRELARIAARPDIRHRLATLGLEPVVNSPEAFSAFIKAEVPRWSRVIRAAQITAGE
jgi:tripartite-type tricarboxylate transporter receptor subunit TctC